MTRRLITNPSAGESVNIVVSEGIRAAIADTGRHKSKNKQPLRQEEQIKLLQRERKRETEKQAKEQQSLALTQGERVKMKMRKFLRRNPHKSQNLMGHTEVGQQG